MNCKDCLKYDACLAYNGGMTRTISMKNKAEEMCGHFKNKAGFVEVVRCCKCKNGVRYVVNNDTFLYKCRKMGISGFADDFYCGYGARRTE